MTSSGRGGGQADPREVEDGAWEGGVKNLIADLRGDSFSRQCDWCATMLSEEDAIPISGGEWVCPPCCGIILKTGTINRIKEPR